MLVAYDVNTETAAGRRRLRLIAKQCVNYGQRVQNSVFECQVDASQYLKLKVKLREIMNEQEDSLRFYKLGENYAGKIEHFGVGVAYDPGEALIL